MSKTEQKIHGIYVELDCLQDTRLATLSLIDPRLVDKVLNEDYLSRIRDDFPPLKKETFDEVYRTRTKDILELAPRTLCVDFILETVISILKQSLSSPLATSAKLYINTFPYKLTDDEARKLASVFISLTNNLIEVSIITMNVKQLTPKFCKGHFTSMFMYDYNPWFEHHILKGDLMKNSMTNVLLYSSKLYFNRLPNKEEKRQMDNDNITPFKAIENLAQAVIDLKLLDIAMFSVDVEKYIKKA